VHAAGRRPPALFQVSKSTALLAECWPGHACSGCFSSHLLAVPGSPRQGYRTAAACLLAATPSLPGAHPALCCLCSYPSH
jgi:hypothetical protein